MHHDPRRKQAAKDDGEGKEEAFHLDSDVLLDRVQGPKLLFLRIVVGGGDEGYRQDSSQDGRTLHPPLSGVFVEACWGWKGGREGGRAGGMTFDSPAWLVGCEGKRVGGKGQEGLPSLRPSRPPSHPTND